MDNPSVSQWQAKVREIFQPPTASLSMPVGQAEGRILAADLYALNPAPAFAMSAMDGYAVSAAALKAALPQNADAKAPVDIKLEVQAQIAAGHEGVSIAAQPASANEPSDLSPAPKTITLPAVQIMTGAKVPKEYDLIIPVEYTSGDFNAPPKAEVWLQDFAKIAQLAQAGKHIRQIGEEIKAGELLLEKGSVLNAAVIGLALATGVSEALVLAPLRVAIIATGDELTRASSKGIETALGLDPKALQQPPYPAWQRENELPAVSSNGVFESNGEMIAAALKRIYPAKIGLYFASDSQAELKQLLAELSKNYDLLITTGGVGSGAKDVVKAACTASEFRHLRLRPGGPQGVGLIKNLDSSTPVIHLPGTPVGAFVGFHLFIAPLFREAKFEIPRSNLDFGKEKPGSTARAVELSIAEGKIVVKEISGSRLRPYAKADALALTNPEHESIEIYPL